MGLTPALCYLIVSDAAPQTAFHLFMGLGALDFLDGWIARNFKGQASVIGSYLDPMADKVLLMGVSLSLAYQGALPLFVVALLVGRDVGLLGVGLWYRAKVRPEGVAFFDATHSGALQMKPTMVSKVRGKER